MANKKNYRWQIAALGAAVMASALAARDWHSPDARLTECRSNLKNIGTALEMYSTDWSGKFPSTLAALTPNYLKTIPHCPNAKADTYSSGASFGPNAPFNEQHYEDYFVVRCKGSNHLDAKVPPDYPAYPSMPAIHERAP